MKTRFGPLKTVLPLALLLIAVLALAAGLSSVQLAPADRFPAELFALSAPPPGQSLGGGQFLIDLARLALIGLLLMMPVYVLYALINRKRRRELILQMIGLGIVVLLLSNVSQCARNAREAEDSAPATAMQPPPEALPAEASLPPFDPNAPDWLVLISSVVLSAALVVTVSLVVAFGIARRRRRATALDQVAQQAEQAAAALEAGGEFRDIIIRCYREMSRVLQQERGIRRDAAMTPREFMAVLRGKGLPDEPVRQLTLAFEAARYGQAAATEQQERAAVDSLRAIVEACRAMGGAP